MDLIDIYRAFYPKAADYTFFSSTCGTFSRIEPMLGHNMSLGKLKKIRIISGIFSDHNAMRLEINYKKKKLLRNTNRWWINNMLQNNHWLTEEIKEEMKKKKNLETSENKRTVVQNSWDAAKAILRGKFIAIQSYLKQEKSQINNLTLYLKQLEKEQTKLKVSKRMEIIKVRAEINEIGKKKTVAKFN